VAPRKVVGDDVDDVEQAEQLRAQTRQHRMSDSETER